MKILRADYNNNEHARAIKALMQGYATDPMGGGETLSEAVLAALVPALAERQDALSLLAFLDEGTQAIGLLTAFEGFSTFKAKALWNIHDVFVEKAYRGRGVASQLFHALEKEVVARGAIKLTLEVLSGNEAAKATYRKLGFSDYCLDPQAGTALFWQKNI